MSNIIKKMVTDSNPEMFKEMEKLEKAYQINQDWLKKNILTENEKDASRILIESNKEARLKSSLDDLYRKEKHLKQKAGEYWTSHHKAEIAAVGIISLREAHEKVEGLALDGIGSKHTFLGELSKKIKIKEESLKMFGVFNNSLFTGTLPEIKES